MTNKYHIKASDPLAYGRLGLSGFNLVVDLVESMHATIARRAWPLNFIRDDQTTAGISRLVYQSVRALPNTMALGIDAALPAFERLASQQPSSSRREALVACINGVMGDHLDASGNPLATPMRFRSRGNALSLETAALDTALPRANGKILLLIHGLCMNDLQWNHRGHSHGTELGKELGFTELHLHYNTGRHISVNGAALADNIEDLVRHWPVPVTDLHIVAHSMGGLVSRSALYYAGQEGHRWPERLRKLVFLGTPHHGSPLERGGSLLDSALAFSPYTAPFTALVGVRSAGITDLRYGNLRHSDWDDDPPASGAGSQGGDNRQPTPLPSGVDCYALAASRSAGGNAIADAVVGDGLVPVASALGEHSNPALWLNIPEDHKAIVYRKGHFDLLGAEVYGHVHRWLSS